MNREELVKVFQNLNIWKRGEQRAPHKPLLLLYALGKCASGVDRLLPYRDIDSDLRKLLIDFGPPRKSFHPEYPFWRLQNDGLWEIDGAVNLTLRQSSTDAKKSELIKYDIHGGFPKDIFVLLLNDRELTHTLSSHLLESHFPASMHQDIMDAVGIEYTVTRKNRNHMFRDKVLRAYEYRCAICGLDIRLDNITLGLDAAHIKWHQAGGPDREENGLALCVLHHRLFDRGAFSLDDNHLLLVSQSVSGSIGVEEWLLRFHNKSIRKPQSKQYYPNSNYLRWHQREVFRSPARD